VALTETLVQEACARGDLDTADRAAVEAFVERHLARHAGDLDKSLAFIQVDRLARSILQDLREPEIEASLAVMIPWWAMSRKGYAARWRP
jgi:hypothetical protein